MRPRRKVVPTSVVVHTRPHTRTASSHSSTSTSHSRKATTLTHDQVAAVFEMPLREAAATLNVCPTSLKRVCRELDIRRWPYRKLKCIDAHAMRNSNKKEKKKKLQQLPDVVAADTNTNNQRAVAHMLSTHIRTLKPDDLRFIKSMLLMGFNGESASAFLNVERQVRQRQLMQQQKMMTTPPPLLPLTAAAVLRGGDDNDNDHDYDYDYNNLGSFRRALDENMIFLELSSRAATTTTAPLQKLLHDDDDADDDATTTTAATNTNDYNIIIPILAGMSSPTRRCPMWTPFMMIG
jgi:hypothetical protein